MIVTIQGKTVFSNIHEAKTFWQRFRGLMGRERLEDGEGMWFENCSSIHCFFMKIPIDVVYCNKEYHVVGVETVLPWKIGRNFKGAKHVLEVRAGAAEQIQIDDVLQFERRVDKKVKENG